MDNIGTIVAMGFLVMMSAYFSATETAFNSLNMTKIKIAAEHGDKTAELIIRLLDDYNRFIAVGQGKLIRKHRESLNLGKRPYARLVGVDANMIRLWKSERKQISLKSWEKYFKDRITL